VLKKGADSHFIRAICCFDNPEDGLGRYFTFLQVDTSPLLS
jgi:hypothetical protein